MQFGYNHNIQHKGKTYHIQTEDTGKITMAISTLLYVGGTILASKKTSYKELKGEDGFDLRELMKQQHKAMLVDLKNGAFDDEQQAKIVEKTSVADDSVKTILDAIESIEPKKLNDIIETGKKQTTAIPKKTPVTKPKSSAVLETASAPRQTETFVTPVGKETLDMLGSILRDEPTPTPEPEPEPKPVQLVKLKPVPKPKPEPLPEPAPVIVEPKVVEKEIRIMTDRRDAVEEHISEHSLDDVLLKYVSGKLKSRRKENHTS